MTIWDDFVRQASEAAGVEPIKLQAPSSDVSGGADLSSSVCFELARERKQPPARIAEEFIGSFDPSRYPLIERVENKNGYLNFFARKETFFPGAVRDVLSSKGDYGKSKSLSGNFLIEFPSVNPNKPWHIGHARNAILGDTLSRVLSAAGYSVTKMDYIEDLGLQVAKVYWGTKNMPSSMRSDQKFDLALGLLYVDVEAEAASNPKTEEGIRKTLHDMESKVEPTASEARNLALSCVRAQYRTAYRLGVYHDIMICESDIIGEGLFGRALGSMLKTDFIRKATEGEKAGCIICDVSDFPEFANAEDKEVVIVRSDGTTTYLGKDVAFQMWKFGLFENPFKSSVFETQPDGKDVMISSSAGERMRLPKFDAVVNVIGAEQVHPQKILYEILGKMGFANEEARSFHLAYEHVWLPEGKFSGRKGTWVGYSTDDVLDEAVARARAEVEKRNPDLPEDDKRRTAEAVGTGAVRYILIKYAPEKKITFRWEEALSFDGDAAPYLQYALARCKHILEKAAKPSDLADLSELDESEYLLAKHISTLPSGVVKIAGSLKKEVWGTRTEISHLAEYAYDLATRLSTFYVRCRVIGSPHEARRLALVEATYWSLRVCLDLLGIPIVDRM